MNLENHPCFNEKVRAHTARLHLPVAPRCNVQCNFCNRQFDCVNESRPGVSSTVLAPTQALAYVHEMVERTPHLTVVGIAGPGDPFANAPQTLETLELVRRDFPDMLLCVATNGLNLEPYVEELARLAVSHVTITVNAVDPDIVKNVYAWMRYEGRVHKGIEAAERLWAAQKASIVALKRHGIVVKINSILIPTVNEDHIPTIARTVAELGADVFNVMPLIPNEGTAFGRLEEPSAELTHRVRARAGIHLKQMGHCSRCRADAVGIVGQENTPEAFETLRKYQKYPEKNVVAVPRNRPYCAVASLEGALVNLHLGQAPEFLIYRTEDSSFVETRTAPSIGGGDFRWETLAEVFNDCSAVFVSGAGQKPQDVLEQKGVVVYTVEGVIEDVIAAYREGKDMGLWLKRQANSCSVGCRGGQVGCG